MSDDNTMKRFGKEQAEGLIAMPLAWISSGLSLEISAKILLEKIREREEILINSNSDKIKYEKSIKPVFMLLAGLTFENYIKAVCVRKITLDNLDKFNIHTHNYIYLVDSSGILFSKNETILITKLEKFVKFAGRYSCPLPKKSEELLLKIDENESILYVSSEDKWVCGIKYKINVGWVKV